MIIDCPACSTRYVLPEPATALGSQAHCSRCDQRFPFEPPRRRYRVLRAGSNGRAAEPEPVLATAAMEAGAPALESPPAAGGSYAADPIPAIDLPEAEAPAAWTDPTEVGQPAPTGVPAEPVPERPVGSVAGDSIDLLEPPPSHEPQDTEFPDDLGIELPGEIPADGSRDAGTVDDAAVPDASEAPEPVLAPKQGRRRVSRRSAEVPSRRRYRSRMRYWVVMLLASAGGAGGYFAALRLDGNVLHWSAGAASVGLLVGWLWVRWTLRKHR